MPDYYDDFAQSCAPENEYNCHCGASCDVSGMCSNCQEEEDYHTGEEDWDMIDPHDRGCLDFADPGGNSALRASSPSNPRNLPCPNCDTPNVLTPADRERGYQCDSCADRAERGMEY